MDRKDMWEILNKYSKEVKPKHQTTFLRASQDGAAARFFGMPNEPILTEGMPKNKAKAYRLGFQAGYEFLDREFQRDEAMYPPFIHQTEGNC